MQQVVTSSSVLTVSELKEHSWKMYKLYNEIDRVKNELARVEPPELKKTHPKPDVVSWDWAKKETERRKKKEIRRFISICLLMFGGIYALYFSNFPYINDNNIKGANIIAVIVTIVTLIVCLLRYSAYDPHNIHLEELRKQRLKFKPLDDENKKIIEENNRIKDEWERKNAPLQSKLNSLKAQAEPYSDLYSIWNNCVTEIIRKLYAYENDTKNTLLLNHLLTHLDYVEYKNNHPMRVLEIVCLAKEEQMDYMRRRRIDNNMY